MDTDALETTIEALPVFRRLRPSEVARVAARMSLVTLGTGETRGLGPEVVLVAVLAGRLGLVRSHGRELVLVAGDWTDDLRALVGQGAGWTATAARPTVLATLDRAALEALFTEVPELVLPFVAELGRELKARNDLLRELVLARQAALPSVTLEGMLHRRLHRHRRRTLRHLGALLVRALVVEPSRRLAFWVFLGVVLALAGARTVVGMILRNGLQGHLFALIGSRTGHPVHVHHFNYGLTLVSLVGLLSMVPGARKALRTLALAFGFGVGLVMDEFALLWNLNPDYYQPSSRLAAGLLLFGLVQAVYFRSLWAAMGRRALGWVRP